MHSTSDSALNPQQTSLAQQVEGSSQDIEAASCELPTSADKLPAEPSTENSVLDNTEQAATQSDAELLKRFITSRDANAFSILVERYQRLVMGVSLRQVGDRHRAEDVFQATFLILAEQARRIRKPNSLASWLHGTARRIGLRALADSQRHPSSTSNLAEPSMTDPALQNVEHAFDQQALDEELSKLPDKYREPLVLHYLEGMTGREVAERLQLSVDAVESRLKRGRNQLRQRLMRRGVGIGVLLAAFQMSQQAAVAASTTSLVEATTASSIAWVSHHTLQGCTANAAHLAGKELAAMTASKMTTILTCTAIVCLGSGIVGAWALDASGGTKGRAAQSTAFETTLLAQADEPVTKFRPVTGANAPQQSTKFDPFGESTDTSVVPIYNTPESDLQLNTGSGVNATRSYRKLSPSRQKIEEQLDHELNFNSALLENVSELAMFLNGQKIQTLVDTRALEDLGISQDEEISPYFEGLTLRENLNLMLEKLDLTYLIKNGVLTITTQDDAENALETVVYEVRHLGENLPSEDVASLIQKAVAVDSWEDTGGAGVVVVVPGAIVVTQSQKVHRDVVQLLEQLEEFSTKTDYPSVIREPNINTPPTPNFHGPLGSPGGLGGGMGGGMGGGGGFMSIPSPSFNSMNPGNEK